MSSDPTLSPVQAYLFCALGIVLSVLIPLLRQVLPKPSGGAAGFDTFFPRAWRIAKPYLALGVFSLLVAILIVAVAGKTLSTPGIAILAGYAWDSTLQKLKGS
jgi:hypothetical protein